MANLTGNLKDSMTATFPREFDIPNPMTIQEIYDKINARAAAFQMPFSIKGGVPGERMQTVHKKAEANEYVADGGLQLTEQYDRYTHTTETRRKINNDSDSGGGTSSCSGGGGSGRSGKF